MLAKVIYLGMKNGGTLASMLNWRQVAKLFSAIGSSSQVMSRRSLSSVLRYDLRNLGQLTIDTFWRDQPQP